MHRKADGEESIHGGAFKRLGLIILCGFVLAQTGCKAGEGSDCAKPQDCADLLTCHAYTCVSIEGLKAAKAKAAQGLKAEICSQVELWAQHQRDTRFDRYSALYSKANFQGTKRTRRGAVKHLARAQWLADRKRMFKPGLTVYAENCAIESKRDARVTVRFQQYWRAGMALRASPAESLPASDRIAAVLDRVRRRAKL